MTGLLLLALQLVLFQRPVTSAYAGQVKTNVVVSVTFADERPSKVCTYIYALDDADFTSPMEAPHCWTPTTDIGSLDVWSNTRLDDGNFKVVFTYRDRPDESIYLVMKVST